MPTITSAGSGAWSAGATWVGGVKPADGDAVVVAAGHAVLMDEDTSGMTGLATVTITSHATDPGMLYWKNGTSGYLKLRTGNNIVGTNEAAKGRLLANSDGVWGNTGALTFASKAVILLEGTAKVDATYLDIALRATHPTNWYVETYGTAIGPLDQSTAVTPADDYIDLGTAPPTAGTAVRVKSSDTLPTGLSADAIYYVRAISGTQCKLSTQNSDAQIVDITAAGSGNLTVYTGHTNTSTNTMNVVQNVTADAPWATTAGHNRVVLADISPADYDQQRVTLAAIAAGTMQLSDNVDSAQYPLARLYLSARNVSVRSAGTTAAQPIIDYATATHGGVFDCEIANTGGTGTISGCGYGVNTGTGHTISGTISGCSIGVSAGTGHAISGTISGCGYGVNTGTGHTISGTISGCGSCVYSGTGHTISGTISGGNTGVNAGTGNTISGTISGCTYGVGAGTGHTISGTISGCSIGVSAGTGHAISGTISRCFSGVNGGSGSLSGATLADNGTDIYLSGGVWNGYAASFASTAQVASYKYATQIASHPTNVTILDLGGVDEAIGSWCPGGYIKTDGSGVHVLTAEDSRGDVWVTLPIRAVANRQVTVRVTAQLSGVAAWTDRPVYAIVDPAVGWKASNELLDSETHANDTDEHTYTLTYTPDHDCELACMVRARGGNASGTGTETCSFTFEILPAAATTAMAAIG